MTRAEIAATYVILNGTIRSPGKYEGEPVYAPHFDDLSLNGEGEYRGHDSFWIEIDPRDREEFPELPAEAKYVQVHVTSDGFTYCTALDDQGQPL